MAVRVIGVQHKMVVSVGVRDSMRMDIAAVEMCEGVLVRMGVVPHERIDHDKRRPATITPSATRYIHDKLSFKRTNESNAPTNGATA